MENPIPNVTTATQDGPTESDTYAALHHLVSRIDTENRMQEVISKAKGLSLDDTQLLVDCLSMALDENAVPLNNQGYVWGLLVKVASSAKIFAQNHTISLRHKIDSISSGVYRIGTGRSSLYLKVLNKMEDDDPTLNTASLISWVHLSNPNILPLYAVFFDDESQPSFMHPLLNNRNICAYTRDHSKVPRMPLIFDVVNGLFHMHQRDLVHGGLQPQNVIVSYDGRAVITDLNTTSESRNSEPSYTRYLAPELLREDDPRPTKAADMWSFACLCYEVLSEKVPFFQIFRDFRVAGAVASGSKPIRPGQNGVAGKQIEDMMWQLLSMCWEFDPGNRPLCLKVHPIFLGMGIHDARPEVEPMVGPIALKSSTNVDLKRARARLTHIVGSDKSSSLRIPGHLRNSLSKLISDTTKLEATASAAINLSPDDTQSLVDFVDLLLGDLPVGWQRRGPFMTLLSGIMASTYIIPQRYKLDGVQYNNQETLTENTYGKAYRGRGLSVRVNIVTDLRLVKKILKSLPNWSQWSHPNLLPFYGVFHQGGLDEISPRFCVVTPLWKNGNIRDYAPTIQQQKRMLLISDVIHGLQYIHDQLGFCYGSIKPLTTDQILISDEGRAVLFHGASDACYIFTNLGTGPSEDERFAAPAAGYFTHDDIWSFGCICYQVLSRKLPYYELTELSQIRSAVNRGQLPRRPDGAGDGMDFIDDEAWDLIVRCCTKRRCLRPSTPEVQNRVAILAIDDGRPQTNSSPTANSILALRSRPDLKFPQVETLLGKIQVEILRSPLSKLIQNRVKDVVVAAEKLKHDDIRILVDFLDLALKNYFSVSEERNRVLALLSKITSSTKIFPQRYELKGIRYDPGIIAEGGYGKVYRASGQNMCVKVIGPVDPKFSTEWIKELILWAHLSNPNILPFYGVFFEGTDDPSKPRICLVSPYMKNKNLHEYAPHLSQKARLPLILDVINGLLYLHGLGIVHSDLKGQNVLISNEGRALITDFGASHIVTATAAATGSSVSGTLRFSAPEVILSGENWQPTKEADIWSFGCLYYEVLSRRVPFYELKLNAQVAAALARKERPRRPGSMALRGIHEDEWDEDEDDLDEDWDTIDNQAWNLVTSCCAPEPEDRLKISTIQALVVDMKTWDDRPVMKEVVPRAELFRLRLNPEIDLNRTGELLEQLQEAVAPLETHFALDFGKLWNGLIL